MRIAICLSHFYPAVGGAERQLLQLAQRWTAAGHPTLVFTRSMPGLPPREVVQGVEIRREIRTLSIGPLFGLSFLASLAWRAWRAAGEFDVLLAGQAPWEAVVAGALRKRLGKPTVARIASTGPLGDLAQLQQAKGACLWKRWFRRNDRFLAPSPQVRAELLAAGAPASRIVAMTNGVDGARYCPPEVESDERPRTALFAGRLTAEKNPWGAVRAFAKVDRALGARLLVAGDGPLRAELQAWVRDRGLGDRIGFLGECDDMPAVYRRASVLLQTSPNEGCSNALLEGMSSGLCPVVSNAPGNRESIRHGETGYAVALDDDAALAAACERLLQNDPQRQSMGRAAREYVLANHHLDAIAGKYLDLFAELVRDQRRRRPSLRA